MIQRYYTLSLALFVPGLIAQALGYWILGMQPPPEEWAATALGLLVGGTLLLIVGVALHAKAKGHSAWWGLLGILGFLCIAWLAKMEDKSSDSPST
jgi:hypothetical protein